MKLEIREAAFDDPAHRAGIIEVPHSFGCTRFPLPSW